MRTMTTTVAPVRPIRARLTEIARAGASTLGSLTGRGIRLEAESFTIKTGADLLGRVAQPMLLLRNRLAGERGAIGYLVARRDAIVLASLTRPGITAEEIERHRRSSVLEPRDFEALQDIGWLLAERGDRVVRQLTSDRVGLAFDEVVAMTPESCARLLPPTREHGVLRLRLSLEGLPPAEFAMVVGPQAYDLLDAEDPIARAEDFAGTPATDEPKSSEGGGVRAFLDDARSIEAIRRCCQKLGTDLELHPRSTAPNPSAIRDGIVVIDVPTGSSLRFDWCQRLKQARPGIKVALLVQQPTRARVLQAFDARADAVIGWPTDPLELAIRLRKLLST